MRFCFFIGCMFIAFNCYAQSDPLTYYIVKKDSTTFYCRLIAAKASGYYVKKDNEPETVLLKTEVEKIYVIDSAGRKVDYGKISKNELNTLKRQALIAATHAKWLECRVIMQRGDTLFAKIKGQPDYTNNHLQFTLPNQDEIFLSAKDIQEMNIYGKSDRPQLYLSVANNMGIQTLYKVLEDGVCKLLYKLNQTLDVAPTIFPESESFFIFYKGQLTLVFKDFSNEMFVPYSVDVIGKSRPIFAACPPLLNKIDNKEFTGKNLREVVKAFNQCLQEKK